MIHKLRASGFALVAAMAAAIAVFQVSPKFETSLSSLMPGGGRAIPAAVSEFASTRVQAVVSASTHENAVALADRFVSSLDSNSVESVRFRVEGKNFPEVMEFYRRYRGGIMSAADFAAGDGLADTVVSRIASPAPSLFRFNEDPYRFLDSFVKSLPQGFGAWRVRSNVLSAQKDGLNHVLVSFAIPGRTSFDIDSLPAVMGPIAENCRRLNLESADGRISLSGVPVHTFETSGGCERQIGALSLFSLVFVVVLARLAFGSFSAVGGLALNLAVSASAGFAAVSFSFDTVHFMAIVLGTTLIGLMVDYSFHRLLSAGGGREGEVKGNMLKSYLTTAVSFLPLAFSGIGALAQASVFLASGLTASLLFNVFCLSPVSSASGCVRSKEMRFFSSWAKFIVPCMAAISLAGLFRVSFSTEAKDIYRPSAALAEAESLIASLSGVGADTGMLVVRGDNLEDVLLKEESLGLPCASLSRFVPSLKKRRAGYEKELSFHEKHGPAVAAGLGFAGEFPPPEKPLEIDIASIPGTIASQFLFTDAESKVMTVIPGVSRSMAASASPVAEFFAPGAMLVEMLDDCGARLLRLLPVSLLLLLAMLFAFYRIRALLVLLPSVLSVAASFAVISFSCGNVNFFHLLASFMAVGMTLDYTIFLAGDCRGSFKAVVCSLLSSIAAFGALSFVSLPVVRAFGVVLGLSLPLSFAAAWALFRPRKSNVELAASFFGLETAWWCYRLFGKRALDAVVWCVANLVWMFNPRARRAAVSRRRLVNFSLSLGDKIAVLSMGRGQPVLTLEKSSDAELFIRDVSAGKGVVALSSHLGNIETLAAYGESPVEFHIFMALSATEVFRAFKERHCKRRKISVHPTEGFSMAELFLGADIVERGDAVLIAGDRGGGRVRQMPFLGGVCDFPEGAFRFAELLERPAYFVASVREAAGYRVFAKKLADGQFMADYVKALEELVERYPDQWYQWENGGRNDG